MIDYDPFADAIIGGDPHPIYKRMRDDAPAFYLEKYDAWALSRFEDIWNTSLDTVRFTSSKGTLPSQVLTKEQPVIPILNWVDPPDHTMLQKMFLPLLNAAAVKKQAEMMRMAVTEFIDDLSGRDEFDVMDDLAMPLASRLIFDFVGVPPSDQPRMRECVSLLFGHDPSDGAVTEEGLRAYEEMNAYCGELAESRRGWTEQPNDAVSAFFQYEQRIGRRMSKEEASIHLGMLVSGGSETIAKGVTLLIYLLHQFPEQKAHVLADRSLILDAFQEALRYDNPTQFLCRTVAQDVTLHGQTLKQGQGVLLLYASGNRDEREFDRPDEFDVRRGKRRILSFSGGPHLCLGIHFARLEARVLVEELLARFPDYELDVGRARKIKTELTKGFAELPMRLARGAA